MKKKLLLIVLIACIGQLKAQTITQSFLTNKPYWNPFFKPEPNSLFKTAPVLPGLNQSLLSNAATLKTVQPFADASAMKYNMPIVKLSCADKMPIVKTDEPGMHYNMPIAGYEPPKLDSMVKVIP